MQGEIPGYAMKRISTKEAVKPPTGRLAQMETGSAGRAAPLTSWIKSTTMLGENNFIDQPVKFRFKQRLEASKDESSSRRSENEESEVGRHEKFR
jgi:hypothetical protein